MNILNIVSDIKKMTVNELRDFIYEKTIINELGLIKKILIIHWSVTKKDIQSLTINLTKKITWS